MKVLFKISKFMAALFLAFIICNVISFFYWNYYGTEKNNPTGSTNFTWGASSINFNLKEGISWSVMDDAGFANRKLVSNPDILLMGSSHLESKYTTLDDSLINKTDEYLPDELSIYNIGMSGHNFPYCVHNYKNAVETYNPKYVVIETADLYWPQDDIDYGLSYEPFKAKGCTMPRLIYENLPEGSLRDSLDNFWKCSPFIRLGTYNIKIWANGSMIKNADVKSDNQRDGYIETEIKNISALLNRIAQTNQKSDLKTIIIYHPHFQLEDGRYIIKQDNCSRQFKEICSEKNILFYDMSNDFNDMYKNQYIMPHGFINTSVDGGHLNKYGCDIMARKISEIIMEDIGNAVE